MSYNFKRDCRNILRHIKTPKQRGGCMPYDTGHLATFGCSGFFPSDNEFIFTMNTGTPYKHGKQGGSINCAMYAYYLNVGTGPHDIPNSFGGGPKSGVGGRFDGKFHPGSKKHVGFYDNADDTNSILGYTINYFVRHYGAEVKK